MASERIDPPPPVDLRLIAWACDLANEIEDGMWGKSNVTIDTQMRRAAVLLREMAESLQRAAPQRHCRYCGWRGHDVLQAGLGRELCPTCQELLAAPQRQEPPSHE